MATYYVSAKGCDNNDGLSPSTAWRTIKKVNSSIKGGDTVCFKRGEIFFGQILPPKQNSSSAPTTYTSYGEGAKPIVSQYKTARSGSWEAVSNGVWRIDLTDTSKFDGNVTELDTNVGFLKVDGTIRPKKRFELDKLDEEFSFYNDERYVYVRSDADPSLLYGDIKLACNIICMRFADNILVEDIVFMGSGAHGISGTVHNATVRNCEFHELGGSELLTYFRPCVRYGNGLECWTDSSDVLVDGCRFSGIYDVAITMQGDQVTRGWENMTFRNNVMWNCQQCFEIWSSGELADTGFQNCVFENNVCIDSGYCWGYDVRPNKLCSSHLLLYSIVCPLCDVTVRNNTFYSARVAPIYKSGGPAQMPEGYKIVDNLFFIDPHQDVIYRNDCNDDEYTSFYKNLAVTNRVVESAFCDIPKMNGEKYE